ncbi:MAG: hypothetical protein HFI31_13590 [Lachnospiraceae bacterium]|jgi:hypothetical protein|nr:hypothetical protein [Lachnospiraceae bacterium]MCI9135198.1 hypothetical protein [Lachnospiraceae bacterium]
MEILFFILVICVPLAITIYSEQGKKRGCGRGCATCGNREICHRRRKEKEKR